MKNHLFILDIDPKTGFVTSLKSTKDEHQMNWCGEEGQWGKLHTLWHSLLDGFHRDVQKEDVFSLTDFSQTDDSATANYKSQKLAVEVRRSFTAEGNLRERLTIRNISRSVFCLNRDTFGIELPFNDIYTYADDCMVHRCNTHIWCGGNVSWINALKMGASDINLGLMLTKGGFASYSQENCRTNVRGLFVLEPETVLLKQEESYVLEWELFWHTGKADFLKQLTRYENYIGMEAEHFTVFEGEDILFRIRPVNHLAPVVTCLDQPVAVTQDGEDYLVRYTPGKTGEHTFYIRCGEVCTKAEFNVKIPFAKLVRDRVHFIVEHQQCMDKESPLYGAYLIYDNKLNTPYFDFYYTDHNACRERMNMPLTVIRYLQLQKDDMVEKSLALYMQFLFREFYEETTGEVFNNIGKTRDALRLYNAPGVMLIFAEMYALTKEDRYLENILTLAKKYYSIGGEKCYSNAVAIRKVMHAFELAGREQDKETLLGFFRMHTDNMIQNGVSYPAHEVNYEQTIVTPTVTCLSEMGLYSQDKQTYLQQARMHLECLDRFSGQQPSFHLNEIAIRFWDGYWFGKAERFGDTLPQHLSCLTGRAFLAYSRLSGDMTYAHRAEECIRNCLCLISDTARGAAAYLYPHKINHLDGEYYDEWANDQDLPLYDAMNGNDLIDSFLLS